MTLNSLISLLFRIPSLVDYFEEFLERRCLEPAKCSVRDNEDHSRR